MWHTLRSLRVPAKVSQLAVRMSGEMRVIPKGRMFSVQYKLPKLPIPPLQQTLEKYLKTVQPLITEQEFANTQQIVQNFLQNEGPKLQKILESRAEEKTNWLSEWWKSVAYLDYRLPLIVNFNPAVVFPPQNYRTKDEQLKFTAKFISGVLDYKRMVDEQSLPVETLGGKPLCMMQYYQILAACRIPGIKKDSHVIHSTDADPPKHINVIHNNHIFSLDVYGKKGQVLNTDQLYQQLMMVVEQSQHRAPPVGLLTTLDRDKWGSVYADFVKDKQNKAGMSDVQCSIFIICIDQPIGPDSSSPPSPHQVAAQMLHGGGVQSNSGNRWFDKTLQFMIGANGGCGLNYEHTTAEGPPIAAIMDHILDYIGADHKPGLPAVGVSIPKRLDFNVSQKTSEAIEEATSAITSLVKDVQIHVFTFSVYGKDFIKQCKLSPDAFIQAAMQLAYFRIFKQPCATYETASLRRFQLGRTDTIRSCSNQTLEFSKGMEDSSLQDADKAKLLRQAVAAHRKYTDEAISGQGVDRHLLGLKLAALEDGQNIPALHLDDAFTESTYFRLSTSQVGAKHDAVMCFGPSAPDGFGVCYNPQKNRINFAVSAFNMCKETDAANFANVLTGALTDMQQLMMRTPESKL